MKMNFVINQMSSLKYFIPLVVEGNKREIRSKFFLKPSNKYNCVYQHIEQLKKFSKEYNFDIHEMKDLENNPIGPTFFTEDHCLYENSSIENKKYVVTTMDDFAIFYNNPDDDVRPGIYINYCDHVIMPGTYLPNLYETLSPKNLYLGSPKYDVALDEKEIKKKYELSDNKKALVIFPRTRDVQKINLFLIYRILSEMGFEILVKSRGKDPVYWEELRGNRYFLDESWYPHTTMELIKASDLIVNFGSTTIKECVLLRKPLIDFYIKPFERPMGDLFNMDYCRNLNPIVDVGEVVEAITYLMTTDLSKSFDEAIEKYLFQPGNVSKKILDEVFK